MIASRLAQRPGQSSHAGADSGPTRVLEVPGPRVTAASPESLLGMKVPAARPEPDWGEIALLVGLFGLETVDEVLTLVDRLHPPALLLSTTPLLIEEIFLAEREVPEMREQDLLPP